MDELFSPAQGKEPWAEEKFFPLRDAFLRLFEQGEEIGAGLCVYVKGEKVLDYWAGYADLLQNSLWQHDTVVSTFSASKAMVAVCLLHLIDRGFAELDEPVVTYWPEFSHKESGLKSNVTIRDVLQHRSGLPVLRANRPGDVYHWDRMVGAIEKSDLIWPTDTETAYHAITFGHIVGEIIRKISGMMPSEYFDKHFAKPYDADYALKLLPSMKDRVAVCTGYGRGVQIFLSIAARVMPWLGGWKRLYFKPCDGNYHPNSDAWRECEAPAISGFGTARGLAKIYSIIGQQDPMLFSSELIKELMSTPETQLDQATNSFVRIGLGVFFTDDNLAPFGPTRNSFGHAGMGGSLGFVDPENQVAFSFVHNKLHQKSKQDPSLMGNSSKKLIDIAYSCLR
ncbi:serine hydrolase domain-containing protein [Kiloniella sp.]|uniref:serine hydrolase domain-containing protein n=1 Tax=Kiloniella sp. TaxID=1938587 RepID=UPI003A917657